MSDQSFTTTFRVPQSPTEVFDAVTKVRGWWSEQIDGRTDVLGGEFRYDYLDAHRCTIRVTELVPGAKVSWLVLENRFDFTQDRTEWTGTTITFEITEQGDGTQLSFTHEGLVPEYECFDVCSAGWDFYVNDSLRSLITNGEGKPNSRTSPRLPAEVQASSRAGKVSGSRS